jgi:hypothetical protein
MTDTTGTWIEVLLEWRDRAAAAGHAVPTVPDMMRIGTAGEARAEGVDLAAVEPWAETIERILALLRAGVDAPLAHLPDDLTEPAPAQSWPVPAPTRDDAVLVALRGWLRSRIGTDPALRGLKEHHFSNIVATGSRTEAEIRRHLPSSLTIFAPRLAEVVARTASTVDGVPPRVRPVPAEPPVADELAALDLADYGYTPEVSPPLEIRKRVGPAGVTLTWPAAATGDPVVLYRVVSADGYWAPHAPQDADPVTVTDEPRCVDGRRFRAPLRHVQVWVHAGRDREAAAAAEPVLHARCVLVAQVTDLRVREDGPSVVGQWTVPPGVESVEILRVPREQARRDGHSGSEYRLEQEQQSTRGFVDDGAERGRHYVYELSVEVELEGTRLRSDPVKVEIALSEVLAPVTDLRAVERADDPAVVDLFWTPPPGGDVRIYRTDEPPAAGVGERTIPVSALTGARLADDREVARPTEPGPDGGAAMRGVPWLAGWTVAYLTPVTVLDEEAVVGPSVRALRLPSVREARIVERTHRQVLTFAWPEGADAVLAYVGGPGQDAASAQRGQPLEISREQYVAQGGMAFPQVLPPRGCSVHLVPVAYADGRREYGAAVTLSYPGLLRLAYHVAVERDRQQRPVSVVVRIRSEYDVALPPAFTLVHRPDRLPLFDKDGMPLSMQPHGDPGAVGGSQFRPSGLSVTPSDVYWTAQVEGLTGYLRMFACLTPERRSSVALYDPAIDTLFLGPAGRAGT